MGPLVLNELNNIRETATGGVLWRRVLKLFANFTGKHLCWNLFLIKLKVLRPLPILKRDSNTGVFYEISKISEKIFFEEHLRTTASDIWTWFVPGKQLQPVNLVNIIKIWFLRHFLSLLRPYKNLIVEIAFSIFL